MTKPPNLADPEELSAYRQELRAYRRPLRMVGLAIVMAGLVMVFWPRLTGRWVMVGSVPLQRIGWWVIAMGWFVLIYIVITRTLYHRRRMRGAA